MSAAVRAWGRATASDERRIGARGTRPSERPSEWPSAELGGAQRHRRFLLALALPAVFAFGPQPFLPLPLVAFALD